MDDLNRTWKLEVAATALAFPMLNLDDLGKLERHEQTLSSLIQERYAVNRDEADRQVSAFLEKYRAPLK